MLPQKAVDNLIEVLLVTTPELKTIDGDVDKVLEAANACQFTGVNGLLEHYVGLSQRVLELIPRAIVTRGVNLNPFWDYVDSEIIKALSEKCSCHIK